MNNQLNFISTYTVEQFKALKRVDEILVKQGKEGKQFLSWIGGTGAVSSRGIQNITRPLVSLVNPETDKEPTKEEMMYVGKSIKDGESGHMVSDPRGGGYFFLLHQEGEGAAPLARL